LRFKLGFRGRARVAGCGLRVCLEIERNVCLEIECNVIE
jgi:hypothetical protein